MLSIVSPLNVQMIVAVAVVISALVLSGVSSSGECQLNCSRMTIPTQCVQAYDDTRQTVRVIGLVLTTDIKSTKVLMPPWWYM